MPNEIVPELVSIPDAQRFAAIGRTTIYNLMASGEIEAVKWGNRTLIRVASLREYIARLPPATFRQKVAA